MPADLTQRARTALQLAVTERGGNLPALGFRPGYSVAGISRGGGGPGFNPLSIFGPSQVPPGSLSPLGLFGTAEGGLAYSVVPDIALALAGIVESLFGGRPKNQATEEIGARLEQTSSPALKALGAAIYDLAQQGIVLSSRVDLQRYFQPLIQRAVLALQNEGYPAVYAKQLVLGAVYNPSASIPAIPTLPQPLVPQPSATQAQLQPLPVGNSGLRPGYQIREVPSEVTNAPSTAPPPPVSPSGGGGLASQLVGMGAAAAQGMRGRLAPVAALPAWTGRAAQKVATVAGLEQAATAVLNLLKGKDIDAEQFGSLAGLIVGAFAGDPAFGAKVGLEVSAAVNELDHFTKDYFGVSLDQILDHFGQQIYSKVKDAIGNLIHQFFGQAPVAPAAPLYFQPQTHFPRTNAGQGGCGAGYHLAPDGEDCVSDTIQEQGCDGGCPEQPPPPLGTQPAYHPIQPPPPLGTQPAYQPIPSQQPQPADCTQPDSPLGRLARQLWNCPTFQNELRNKLQVKQRPGQKPTIDIKQPICLCCESTDDLTEYVNSGGAMGNCTQVQGGQAELVPVGGQ